ncbi:MAG TPA: MmgE/PrpD family protein [Ramlibacter sp.]|nr:MmgE/PrpD family protein [Ramlibacter sp.]
MSAISKPPTEHLTREVARFICDTPFLALPDDVVALGKKSILDGLGLALSGGATHCGGLVRQHFADLNLGAGPATVIGTNLKIAPRFAAFANGVAIHADDYDDTQLAVAADRVYGLLTHPTAPALPAALAMAQATGANGGATMLAYHLGVEVECKIAEAINPRHYQAGFHTTATCGTFAAAAASARLLGLDAEATARALSIAGSQSAGLRENFGTMTKPFHAGRASESGLAAAQFASYGWTATDRILDAPRGFFSAAGGGYDPAAIAGKLGAPWTLADPGVSIKPHPSGSLTHPGMTEMLSLIRANGIKAKDVVRVRVGTNHNMPNALIHHRPVNELQAKFSMEFCMAILLLEGRAGLGEFTDEVVLRPDVKAMIEKIDFGVDQDAEAAGYHKMTTIIDIHLADGRTISGRSDFGKGSPANPMSYEEVADKFRENAAYAKFPAAQAESVVAMVRDFETLPSLDRLMAALTRAG